MPKIYDASVVATVPSLSLTLDHSRCTITLDRTRAPYIEANLTVNNLVADNLQQLSPLAGQRITLAGQTVWTSPAVATQSRTFDLVIHEVRRIPNTDQVTIIASSDEALAIDGGLVSDQDGGAYVDTTKTNLIPNPSAEGDTTGWVANGGSTLSRVAGQLSVQTGGTGYFRVTRATAGTYGLFLGSATSGTGAGVAITAGHEIAAQISVKAPDGRTVSIALRFYDAAGAQIGPDITKSGIYKVVAFPTPPLQLSVSGVAPGLAVKAAIYVYMVSTSSGENLYADNAYLYDVDEPARVVPYTGTLRTIIDSAVLTPLGLTGLGAGSPDADYSVTTNAVNLIPNPSAETNTTGWVANSNGTLSRVAGTMDASDGGSYFFRVQATAAGTCGMPLGSATSGTGAGIACTAGETYTGRIRARWSNGSGSSPKAFTLEMRFYDASGNPIGSVTNGAAMISKDGTGTVATVTAVAPTGAAKVRLYPYFTAAAANERLELDAAYIVAGSTVIPYFDGSTPADAQYYYTWASTAHGSQSLRTRIDDRDQSLLTMKPGTTYWDFIQPLVRAAGLRLWCDETRVWRLNTPTAAVAGTVAIAAGDNAKQVEDVISLRSTSAAGTPLYFTGIVIRYEWVDAAGITQIRYDYAGTSQKVHRVTINRPWPGPGAAADMLAAAQRRGRQQTVQAIVNLDATPGMAYSSTGIPGLSDQTGSVAAVTFIWSSDSDEHGTMRVTPADLVNA